MNSPLDLLLPLFTPPDGLLLFSVRFSVSTENHLQLLVYGGRVPRVSCVPYFCEQMYLEIFIDVLELYNERFRYSRRRKKEIKGILQSGVPWLNHRRILTCSLNKLRDPCRAKLTAARSPVRRKGKCCQRIFSTPRTNVESAADLGGGSIDAWQPSIKN